MMLPAYLLAFCRIALGLTFALSFVGKVRDVGQFSGTIRKFDLLPAGWAGPTAVLFLSGEAAVVVLLILGGRLLTLALALAGLLLAIFSLALLSALRRGIETSCNCFGASAEPVSYLDIWRNTGLISLAALGFWAARADGAATLSANLIEAVLLLIMAAVFVLLWTNLAEVLTLFRSA
jgi:hypothetical protein